MKKIFSVMMAAALVAFSMTSCKKDKNEPEQGGETAAFKIEVSNITATGATVAVTPADTTITYYWDIVDAATAAKFADDAAVAAYYKEYFDYVIQMYQYYYGQTLTYADLLLKGANSYTYESLEANTEYVVIAIALDENVAAKGASVKKSFKTPDIEIVGHETLVMTGVYDDEIAEEGWYQIMAYSTDSTRYISLSPDPVESLTQAISFDDLDLDWSYIYVGTTKYSLIDANYTASLEGDVLTATGTLVAENGIEYQFTATCVPYVAAEEEAAPAKKVAAKKLIKKAPKAFRK